MGISADEGQMINWLDLLPGPTILNGARCREALPRPALQARESKF
jgi:hypothetical protein